MTKQGRSADHRSATDDEIYEKIKLRLQGGQNREASPLFNLVHQRLRQVSQTYAPDYTQQVPSVFGLTPMN